ncbi:MAG: sialate O-acetylesterase [Sedimentisphaerales bacterium]|jgi:sialate O-acetylesterase
MSEKTICAGKKQTVIFLAVVLVLSGVASADIRLPSVIGDNMVLQQGMQVPIWGWADPCERIVIKFGISSRAWSGEADANGKWMVKIEPGKTGGPYEMTIEGKNMITLKNILVGEVWVCSGQSNMEFMLNQAINGRQEANEANFPQIRLFTVGKKVSYEPMKNCSGRWQECKPPSASGFSAVGYFFGRELYKQLNVPIGLIHTSWGGTPAESWMSSEYLEADANFKPILRRFEETVANYPELLKKYQEAKKERDETIAKLKAEGKPVPPMQEIYEPVGKGHQYSPTGLYNGMILPIVPYGIRGAIWYQGESNAGRAYQYRTLFPAMIKNWRQTWGEGDFPFLFVQLANYKAVNPEPTESDWAELQEAQLMTLSTPNTGMAVTIDIGDANNVNNIHPPNKQDVGKRLALWALAKTYGKDIVYSGPIYKSMTVEGNKVVLSFNNVGGGLVAKGDLLKGFAIAGADKKFVWADAKIEGDTIVVSSDKIGEPAAVRYAWANNPVCNLYNKEGLPATPFRTDDWPGITMYRK